MTNVLLLTSSPRGEASYSTRVATEFVQKIAGAHTTVRELWRNPLPHIGPDFIHGLFTPEENRTTEQKEQIALSDGLVAELQAADIVVVGAGMINFGMPSSLKAWIDYVTRSGVTFRYSEAGPEGLLKGKKLVLVLAEGGVYSSEPMTAMNHLEPPLRTNLGFIGLTDVETILIDGVAMGPEATEKALANAEVRATELAATYTN